MPRLVSGNRGGSVVAKAATVNGAATGAIYTVRRLLGSASTLALITGTNSNLTLNATTGAVSAAVALGTASQTAKVREVNGQLAIEYPVALTGVAIANPTLSLSSGVTQAEGNTGTSAFVWTLTLNRDGSTASFPYSWAVTGNGTDPANAADFGGTLPSGSGTFAPGETSKTITVLVAGDTAVEPAETFLLTVTAAGLTSVTSTGTISNDDGATPDYIIQSDADWATIPAGLKSGGGLIEVKPGSYTTKTLSGITTTTNPLIFKATNRAVVGDRSLKIANTLSRSRVDQLVFNGTGNVVIDGLELVSTSWQNNPVPCVAFSGTETAPTFRWCHIHAGYRGNVDTTHNVVLDLPEYACVSATLVSGTITALNITRAYVGDLVAPGTYPLTLTVAGTGFSATMTVSSTTQLDSTGNSITGNHITSFNLSSGGTGIAFAHSSKLLTFTGQKVMADNLPYGFQSRTITGTPRAGVLTVEDCLLEDLSNAIKAGGKDGTYYERNTFRRIYQDAFSTGLGVSDLGQPGFPITGRNNFSTLPFSKSGDAGDPHSDQTQLFGNRGTNPTSADWKDITYTGNIHVDGVCRGGVQGFVIADMPPGIAHEVYIAGNAIISKGLPNGTYLDYIRNSFLYRNLFIRYNPTGGDSSCSISVVDAGENNFVRDNVSEALSVQKNGQNVERAGNVVMGAGGSSVSYASVFANPTGTRSSVADLVAAYTGTGPALGKGAFVSDGYINWTTGVVDRALEPSYIRFTPLVNQVASATVTTAWRKLISGPSSQTISISNGLYQIADDAVGTNATTATSTSGTVARGKYIRATITNGAGSSQASVAVLTINGQAFNASSTTASTAVYPIVAFDASGGPDRYQSASAALFATNEAQGTLFIPKYRTAGVPAASVSLWYATTGVASIQVQLLTSGSVRVTLRNGATTVLIMTTSINVSDNIAHDLMFSWDVSQVAIGDAGLVLVDGVSKTTLSTYTGGPGSVLDHATPKAMQFGGLGVAGANTLFTGELGGLFVWPQVRYDFNDAVALSKFAADQIGRGQNTTGNGINGTPARVALVGTAAQWAAGLNWGTGAAYSPQSGAALTDVSGAAWS